MNIKNIHLQREKVDEINLDSFNCCLNYLEINFGN